MKQTISMNPSARRFCKLALAPAVVITCLTLGNATTAQAQNVAQKSATCQAGDDCSSLEGTWLYSVTIPDAPAPPIKFLGTETYAAGGGYVEADQLSFTTGYLATAGHGAWRALGGEKFLLTYVNLTYDNKGNATGSSKVRQTMKVAGGATTYSGTGDFTYYDNDGNVVASGTFVITANRVTVELPGS